MPNLSLRAILAVTGAIAGLAFYVLIDERALAGVPAALHRFVVFLAIAGFPAFGLMAGPLTPAKAALRAALLATVVSALMVWAGFRFEVSSREDIFLPTGQGLLLGPFLLLAALLIPFTINAGTKGGWRNYESLFTLAWTAGIKVIVSLLFLGLFWAVYFLSHELLSLAGIEILDDFMDLDWGPYLLNGLVLGIALAVTCELEGVIQTLLSLVLRLLRLLLVPVTAVITLFVVAALAQGLGTVFSSFSAASTMMLMAGGAVLLVIAALEATDAEASTHPAIIWSTRLLALVLPIMSAIALYALWLRISEYGWTPPRLLASLGALIVALFTLPIAFFALPARPGWQRGIRQSVVWGVIAAIGLSTLWFTPLLNAQRISASSQLARLLDGRIDAENYSFWPMAKRWGHAGTRAISAYEATSPPEAVAARISSAIESNNRYDPSPQTKPPTSPDDWNRLRTTLLRRPESATLPSAAELAPLALGMLSTGYFMRQCDVKMSEGEAEVIGGEPSCIAIQDNFLTQTDTLEWMLVTQESIGKYTQVILITQNEYGRWSLHPTDHSYGRGSGVDVIEPLSQGNYEMVPPRVQGLSVGDLVIMPRDTGD